MTTYHEFLFSLLHSLVFIILKQRCVVIDALKVFILEAGVSKVVLVVVQFDMGEIRVLSKQVINAQFFSFIVLKQQV